MRPAASGMRAADSAAPRSSRIDRRSAVGASSSSARRRNRTAWSAEPRLLACRAEAAQRIERPLLTNGAGGARGQQVGGHTLAPSGISRELTSGGQMQLHPLGRRDRVVQRLLDDRMDEPRRQARMEELGLDQRVHRLGRRLGVYARDHRGVRQRGIVAENRQRLRHGPNRRRASPQPSGHEPGHRRRAHGGDRAGVEAHVLPASLLEGGDELTREQRVPARRPAHSTQTSSSVSSPRLSRTSSAMAAELSGGGRTDVSGSRLDQLGQGFRRRRRLARPNREDHAGRDLLDPAPPGRRGTEANARRPSAHRRRAGRAAARRPASRTASAGRGIVRTGDRRRPLGREPPRTAGAPVPRHLRRPVRARAL